MAHHNFVWARIITRSPPRPSCRDLKASPCSLRRSSLLDPKKTHCHLKGAGEQLRQWSLFKEFPDQDFRFSSAKQTALVPLLECRNLLLSSLSMSLEKLGHLLVNALVEELKVCSNNSGYPLRINDTSMISKVHQVIQGKTTV